ncbi:MAG: amidohydrolase family protein [Bacillota bacterium]|jgi:imidazolonepropionase-like amidohydrolase
MYAITNGHIITMEGAELPHGTMLVDDEGLVGEIGDGIEIPAEAQIIDMTGKYIMPGLIDAHCHMGISQDIQSMEAELEFMDDYILPSLRTIDAINPVVSGFEQARKSGITTIAVSPGSTHVIGGQIAVIKTIGKTVDSMILKEPAALKMALGEMFFYRGIHRKPTQQARMIVTARLREAFVQGENYRREDDSFDLDLDMDILMQAVEGRLPIVCHAHRADDIMTALRLAKEFSLRLVLVHATEAEIVADELVDYDASVIVSPGTFGKVENWDKIDWDAINRLQQKGLNISICSDHPYNNITQLLPAAIAAHKAGLPRYEALKAVTINSANILGVEDEVGSLAEDKHADFVVFDGDPLNEDAEILEVWINGKPVEKLSADE